MKLYNLWRNLSLTPVIVIKFRKLIFIVNVNILNVHNNEIYSEIVVSLWNLMSLIVWSCSKGNIFQNNFAMISMAHKEFSKSWRTYYCCALHVESSYDSVGELNENYVCSLAFVKTTYLQFNVSAYLLEERNLVAIAFTVFLMIVDWIDNADY